MKFIQNLSGVPNVFPRPCNPSRYTSRTWGTTGMLITPSEPTLGDPCDPPHLRMCMYVVSDDSDDRTEKVM